MQNSETHTNETIPLKLKRSNFWHSVDSPSRSEYPNNTKETKRIRSVFRMVHGTKWKLRVSHPSKLHDRSFARSALFHPHHRSILTYCYHLHVSFRIFIRITWLACRCDAMETGKVCALFIS